MSDLGNMYKKLMRYPGVTRFINFIEDKTFEIGSLFLFVLQTAGVKKRRKPRRRSSSLNIIRNGREEGVKTGHLNTSHASTTE